MSGKEGRTGRRAVLPYGSKLVGVTLPPADYARVLAVVEARERRDIAARAADPFAASPSLVVGAATPACVLRDVVYVGLAGGALARAVEALQDMVAEAPGALASDAALTAAEELLDLLATLHLGQPVDIACPVEPGSLDALARAAAAPAERARRRAVGEEVAREVLAAARASRLSGDGLDTVVTDLRDLMLEARAYDPEPGVDHGDLPVFPPLSASVVDSEVAVEDAVPPTDGGS